MRSALQPGTLALAVSRSTNAKIGEAATTYAAQASCPNSCVFKDGGGCYAEDGPIGKFVTGPLNRAAEFLGKNLLTPVGVARAEGEAIDGMEVRPGVPLRLHTVGDCASDEAAQLVAAAAEGYVARGGGPVWTYTHAWRDVARASWGGVSVLASCETAEDVEAARARGYATALVVEEFPTDRLYGFSPQPKTFSPQPKGRTTESGATADLDNSGQPQRVDTARHTERSPLSVQILPCPAQTRKGVSCSSCRLCFDDGALRQRGYSIGFALHGVPVTLRHARKALADPSDPDRKLSSRVLIPRYEAEFQAQHGRLPTHTEVGKALDLHSSSVAEMRRSLRGIKRDPRRKRKAVAR